MSAEALPYTLLIIFAEFTIGGLWVLWLADLRGTAAASFIKFGAGLVVVTALALPYGLLPMRGARRPGLVAGGLASAAGLASIALLSQVFAIPTWGYAGTLLSLTIGALVVGAVSMGMILGHWYLVTPRLPEQPLRELT